MTSVLLVLLTLAALGASAGLLAAHLGLPGVADTLALTGAACGFVAFSLVVAYTAHRARAMGKGTRP